MSEMFVVLTHSSRLFQTLGLGPARQQEKLDFQVSGSPTAAIHNINADLNSITLSDKWYRPLCHSFSCRTECDDDAECTARYSMT